MLLVIPYKRGHKDFLLGCIKTIGKPIPKYTEEFKRNLVTLYRNGKSQSQLCAEFGFSHSAFAKWLNASPMTLRITILLN